MAVVRTLIVLALLGAAQGCFIVRRVALTSVPLVDTTTQIRSRTRLHLDDGSVLICRDGFVVKDRVLQGDCQQYGLTLADSTRVATVRFDRVQAIVTFETEVHGGKTLLYSSVATGVTLGALLIAYAASGGMGTMTLGGGW